MKSFKFNRKNNGVPVLSREEIESIAEIILKDYNPELLKDPKALDVDHLLECYAGLEVDYKDLTHNKSILGMIVFDGGYVPVYDKENNVAKRLTVEEGTVLIDNSLLENNQIKRGRFTVCHEIAHYFLHKDKYQVDKNQLDLFNLMPKEEAAIIKCRTGDIESTGRKELITANDWMEWQADSLASALLMPEDVFITVFDNYTQILNLESRYDEMRLYANTDVYAEGVLKHVANVFNVSLTAAKIRLKNLGPIRETRQQSII